jgi:uncharacterized membrane protein
MREAAVSNKSAPKQGRAASGGGARRDPSVREQKRAQFERPRGRTGLHLVLADVALVAIAAVTAFVVMGHGAAEPATITSPVAAGSADVTIPVADLADGQAKYYGYDAGGVEVKYFVLKSADGEYRAAFDACDVCYPKKKATASRAA